MEEGGMMGLDANLMDIIKFSLTAPLKDRKSLKYLAFIFAFVFVVGLMTNYFTYTIFKPLVSNPALVSNSAALMGILIQFLSYIGSIIVLYIVVVCAIQYLLAARALELLKRGAQPATPLSILRFIILGIAQVLCALFSIFNLKMLLMGVAGAILFIVGLVMVSMTIVTAPAVAFVGAVLLVIGIIALLAYAVVVIHNVIRIALAEVALVEKGLPIKESLRASWGMTEGNVINIFVIVIVLEIILGIINVILSAPSSIYSFFAAFMGITSTGLMVDPVYSALLIPSCLSTAFMVAATVFCTTAIYSYLSVAKKAPSAAIASEPSKPRPKAKKKAKKK